MNSKNRQTVAILKTFEFHVLTDLSLQDSEKYILW